jgi:hypothetical protein
MTNTKLSFIKTGFASVQGARQAAHDGKIVFDKQHKIICVEGDVYGGNIADVRWIAKDGTDTGGQTSILRISYADGTHKDVDFSDVASAQTTLHAFQQLGSLVGNQYTQGGIDGTSSEMNYGAAGSQGAANYIAGETTLRGADMKLDEEIKLVNDRIGQPHASSVDYTTDTQYLQGVVTLTGADKELDARIKEINARIGQAPGAQGVVVEDIDYGTDRYLGTNGTGGTQTPVTDLKAADLRLSQKISELENSAATYEIRKIADGQRSDTTQDGIAAQYGLFKITHTYNAETGAVSETVEEVTSGTANRVNIPKDFLVKEAHMLTVVADNPGAGQITAAEIAQRGGTGTFNTGDKVLEFVVNTKVDEPSTDTELNTYLYINVNDLFDSYTGDSANVIDYSGTAFTERTGKIGINVDQTNNRISATVAQGAIHANELNADVLTLDAGANLEAQDATKRLAGEVKVNDESVNLAQINHSNGSTNIPLQVNFYWDTYDNNMVPDA